jgi:N-methylhydantoinase B
MALTVDGGAIRIDLAGSSPQVDRAINVALCYTIAYTSYGVKCAVAPEVPNNEGCFRPVAVTAPPGSIVNAQFPAAGGCRLMVGHYLPVLVFQALGRLVPDRVMAAAGSPLWGIQQSGLGEDGKPYANMLFFNGGMGAHARGDGPSTLSWPSNVSSTPVEIMEQISPFRIHHKRLRADSGGDGRHRGGLGQEIRLEHRRAGKIAAAFLAERTRIAAPGLEGGGPGAPGEVRVDGQPVDPKKIAVLETGAVIDLATPGGGGFGPRDERSAEARERDHAFGYVTRDEP